RLHRRVACAIHVQPSNRSCGEGPGVDVVQGGFRKSEVALRSRGVSARVERAFPGRSVRRTVIFVVSVITLVTAAAFAQSSGPDLTVSDLQKQLLEMRAQMAVMQNRIATLEAVKGIPETSRTQSDETTSVGEQTASSFKGLTITPGGFLQSTALVRRRNENADVATSYSAIPLNGSPNANLSELRGTARTAQLSLLIQGSAGKTKLRGYVETDFLGAGA